MIQNENSPTLCPRCTHFEKKFGYPGCQLVRWREDVYEDVTVRAWLRRQTDETSWEYMGACPLFVWNGSEPPSHENQNRWRRALRRLNKDEP